MNSNLTRARVNKNDEFYTQYEDIEKEVSNYAGQLDDKVVYCNCDSDESEFVSYFKDNFNELGIKKLVATHYNDEGSSYKIVHDGKHTIKLSLKGNGDFRSEECVEILKEADIVVTNPPFSLFREYVAQLVEYEKDFLIMGSFNAVTYVDVFPIIQSGHMKLGYNSPKDFVQPDGTVKSVYCAWFTTLDVEPNSTLLDLESTYNPDLYPAYDNYKAIEVGRVKSIPKDYDGVMGVPITYLHHHNPDQFEILGLCNEIKDVLYDELAVKTWPGSYHRPVLNGKTKYARIMIRRVDKEDE